MKEMENLVGRRFNHLIVIEFDHKEKTATSTKYVWKCRCDCGREVLVSRNGLMRGRKSCNSKDCPFTVKHSYDCSRSYHGGVATHGMSSTRFYRLYRKMLERCYYEKDTKYDKDGIEVCDRWKESFENFRDDMYDSYQKHVEEFGEKNTTLDRIDYTMDYYKENCRWATIKEQANNKSNNVIIEFKGESHTISEWADKLGWSYYVIANRYKRGWSVDRMLTQEPRIR